VCTALVMTTECYTSCFTSAGTMESNSKKWDSLIKKERCGHPKLSLLSQVLCVLHSLAIC